MIFGVKKISFLLSRLLSFLLVHILSLFGGKIGLLQKKSLKFIFSIEFHDKIFSVR